MNADLSRDDEGDPVVETCLPDPSTERTETIPYVPPSLQPLTDTVQRLLVIGVFMVLLLMVYRAFDALQGIPHDPSDIRALVDMFLHVFTVALAFAVGRLSRRTR